MIKLSPVQCPSTPRRFLLPACPRAWYRSLGEKIKNWLICCRLLFEEPISKKAGGEPNFAPSWRLLETFWSVAGAPCSAPRKAWAAFGGKLRLASPAPPRFLLYPKSVRRNKYLVCKLKTRNDLYVYKPALAPFILAKELFASLQNSFTQTTH